VGSDGPVKAGFGSGVIGDMNESMNDILLVC